MLEKLDFAGLIRLLDEVMILPVTIIGLLACNWRTFQIVWFSFQSVDNKQYINSNKDLIVVIVFFHIRSWFK